jgi:hypothetical protein
MHSESCHEAVCVVHKNLGAQAPPGALHRGKAVTCGHLAAAGRGARPVQSTGLSASSTENFNTYLEASKFALLYYCYQSI